MKIVITTLAIMPIKEVFAILEGCFSSPELSVFTMPSSPTSYIQENIITTGKPKMVMTTRNLIVQLGIRRAGIIIPAACKMTKAVARYMAALLKTFRFFNSAMKLGMMNDN